MRIDLVDARCRRTRSSAPIATVRRQRDRLGSGGERWTDLLRTAISIREGRVSSVTLLRYLSEPELREQITAITNKAEAFHGYRNG